MADRQAELGRPGGRRDQLQRRCPARDEDDGDWHVYRFDWHTDTRTVDFYVDGVAVASNTTHVPTRAGRLWIGAWFPNGWAGEPDFDSAELVVDWVRVTAFGEAADEWVDESHPDDGWADPSEYPT